MDHQSGPSESPSNPSNQYSNVFANLSKSAHSGRTGPSHNATGKPLCQICFELDEAAFRDQTNYSMSWLGLIRNCDPNTPYMRKMCETCLLIRDGISQFEPRWVQDPISSRNFSQESEERNVSEQVNVSVTVDDGLIVSFRELRMELYGQALQPSKLHPISTEHVRTDISM
jgi:hypothetical protein